MSGVALFERGPLAGACADTTGVELSYVVRGFEGTVDEFVADLDVTAGGWTLRTLIDFSRGRGTKYRSLELRGPASESFEDVTSLVRICPPSLFTDGAFPRDVGFSVSDCMAHALLVRLEALGLPELPEACRVSDGIMTWPQVDRRA